MHQNFEVGDPSLVSVQLDVVLELEVDGVPTGPLTFTFTFNHEETPNNQTPCPYPTPPGEGCTDRVTIVASPQPTTFQVDGVDYTLMMNFLVDDNPVSEYITRESGTTNSSGLVGDFEEPPPPPGTPVLMLEKSGPATMKPAEWGDFVIDVQNAGVSDAFNVTLVDRLPDGPTGGMCETTPQVLSARVFASDGVTLVPGKGPLVQGADYSLVYNGAMCELTFSTQTAASGIGVGERLVIAYRTQLDPDTQHGSTLTNVAGATEWFNDDDTNPSRIVYTHTLTDGTVGITDHEDAHTVAVALPGYFFEKSVVNLTTGESPATMAQAGDTLRYTLRLLATDDGLDNFTFYDDLDALNAPVAFEAGTLAVVGPLPGDAVNNSDPNGGTKGTGLVDIGNMSLAAGNQALIQFDITVAATGANGMLVTNQSQLLVNGVPIAVSDDPNVNGQADPFVTGDEDPTRVVIDVPPAPPPEMRITRLSNMPLSGASPQPASIGEELEYELVATIPSALLRNFVIRDELPEGLRCAEAPVIDLGAAPYAAAGFQPGGIVTPTCTNNLVEWNFGDREVTQGDVFNRYELAVRFLARVENTAATNEGGVIVNGGAASSVTVRYINEANEAVVLDYGSASIVVREPVIELAKSFNVTGADAGDVLTVTVTATNTGTAKAYDLRVLDDLTGKKLTFLGSLGGADPPNNVDTTTLGPNRPIFSWNAANPKFAIAPGETRSFTFTVGVDAATQPQEVLDNTIQASWTSLPSRNTSLNSTGLIGVDGAANGMRNGALPNSGNAVNDYEATATQQVLAPAGAISKADLSPAIVPAIGAHKTFEIEISLPEGTTDGLVVVDNLAAGTAGYVLANNPAFDISYGFSGIAAINGQPPSEGAFNAFPADNTSGTATWNIGTVVTSTENDLASNAIGPRIRIVYQARVNNDVDTTAGDGLQNGVTVSYAHGETGDPIALTDAATAVTVVEPRLTLSKTVVNVTPGKLAADEPVAGDTLEYRVIAANTGNSTAFDANLVDTLPPGVVLDSDSTPAVTINLAPVTGFIATPTGAPAGPLVWGKGNGDESLDVPAGDTLILTYRVRVLLVVSPDGVIENGIVADWTSLDGDSPYERTGSGCPDVTPPNTYCAGPAVATITGVTTSLVFWKSVINADTGQEPGRDASPGDTLRYRILLRNVSGFPLSGLALVDQLDAHFASGTLALDPAGVPAEADVSNTDPHGGANGTGRVDIRNLRLGAAGFPDDRIAVEFAATLTPVIDSGTVISNQAQLVVAGATLLWSDDPDENGPDDPQAAGDEDPTRTVISSAPALRVQKTSEYLGGDPAILLAGETLRYTITVRNIGNEDAVDVLLRDLIPANTNYVPDSTTLNGSAVFDPADGASPLKDGLAISTPGDPAGVVRADPGGGAGMVATVTFDVIVSGNVADGAVISNQGFVTGSGAGGGAFPEAPSDDPRTPAPNDPTRDIVGNLPLVYAQKTVQIQVDNNANGLFDAGDTARYTISISNSAAAPATGVVLTDPVPADTTYSAGSVRLNGEPVGGASAPVLQLPIGTLSPGATAVVTFDVVIDDGVTTGSVISNQASIASNEAPTQLTDADGNPSNGYQPTIFIIGDAQLLTISKEVFVVGADRAEAGGQLEYVVRIDNISGVPATNVVITDDLGAIEDQLTYVAGSATLDGATNGTGYAGGLLTADHSAVYNSLAPGATAVLRFRADIEGGLAIGTSITNTASVTWDTPTRIASDTVALAIGGTPGSAVLSGRVWHDANQNRVADGGEPMLDTWTVDLYRNGQRLATVFTGSDGSYQIGGLAPNDENGDQYEIRFAAPWAGPNTAMLGHGDSPFANGLQRIAGIVAPAGRNLQDLNLPIDPNGVIYDSVARTSVAGATLVMLRASTGITLPAGCFDDPAQQGQITPDEGFYRFDLNFGDPACPAGADYLIEVTAPATGYIAAPSRIIPPTNDGTRAAYSVPICPEDAIPDSDYCEAQDSAFAPSGSVPARSAGTNYYLHLSLSNGSVPQESQIFNNHIAIDPELDAAIAITKTTPMVNVTRATLVPYTITVRNTLPVALDGLAIIDTLPPGFKYVAGSARFDGTPMEPVQNGRQLSWDGLHLFPNELHAIKLLLVVGSGVSEGEYINSAQVVNTLSGGSASGIATATVRVIPDPTFDCTDIIGKVFDDADLNGHQDADERGISGARIVSARGLIATTDAHGRFHITCAAVPDQDRGSNLILKLDERTLPGGYRVTTENPLVQKATRGKMMKFNFGAAIHRVVGLGVAEGVFESESVEIRPQWLPRIDVLLEELKKAPSILRISYMADLEDEALVRRRIERVKGDVKRLWRESECCRPLTIETQVFWRRGAPVDIGAGGARKPAASDPAASQETGD